jgi:dephospho-CoA kinase
MERDGLTAAEVGAIMRVQSSREARLARATDIISNDRDVAFLTEQVKRLHEKYQRSGSAQRN